MADAKNVLLDLTLPERRTVRIDGQEYEVLAFDELNLAEALKFSREVSGLAKLSGLSPLEAAQAMAAMDESEVDSVLELVRKLSDKMLLAPEEVRSRLSDVQRMRLVQAVFSQPAQGLLAPATPSPNSSPDSSASTVETPRNG